MSSANFAIFQGAGLETLDARGLGRQWTRRDEHVDWLMRTNFLFDVSQYFNVAGIIFISFFEYSDFQGVNNKD